MTLRLMIFDRTDRGRRGLPGLSSAWRAGATLYRGLGRLDVCAGVSEWGQALDWIIDHEPEQPIAEIQFWGHGNWGTAKIAGNPLDIRALASGHEHHRRLCAIRDRLAPGALWWFRTCETFGADRGHDFAKRWTEFFGCRAAGHTYVIGYWQSGLHSLRAGDAPDWSTDEGLEVGTPTSPEKALRSRRHEPNTISCLRGTIPEGY